MSPLGATNVPSEVPGNENVWSSVPDELYNSSELITLTRMSPLGATATLSGEPEIPETGVLSRAPVVPLNLSTKSGPELGWTRAYRFPSGPIDISSASPESVEKVPSKEPTEL